jgi:hypothetical protein
MTAGATCATCRHFEDRPAEIERGLPGLAVLSSAHGAGRASDGLCVRHDRYLRSSAACEGWAART